MALDTSKCMANIVAKIERSEEHTSELQSPMYRMPSSA